MNKCFPSKRLLKLIAIMLTFCGSFTPLAAQEIIEYDYECTRYEDESENTYGSFDKVRVRFGNDKVSINYKYKDEMDWCKSGGDYLWLTYRYDGMTDDNMAWFKAFSDANADDIGFNKFVIISEDRDTVICLETHSDKFKNELKKKHKDTNIKHIDRAEIYTRSASKSSKKPSWMK